MERMFWNFRVKILLLMMSDLCLGDLQSVFFWMEDLKIHSLKLVNIKVFLLDGKVILLNLAKDTMHQDNGLIQHRRW